VESSCKSPIDGVELEDIHAVFDAAGQPHFTARFHLLIGSTRSGAEVVVTDELSEQLLLNPELVRVVYGAFNALKDKAERLFLTYHPSVESKLEPGVIADF